MNADDIDLPTLLALAAALDEHDAKVIRMAAAEIERLRGSLVSGIAAEREACAKIADGVAAAAEKAEPKDAEQAIGATYGASALRAVAKVIRARR